MFDDEKIRLIEALPEADTILIIWVKLLCLAGKTNASGYIFLSERMPYNEEMLATIFNRPLNTVRLALTTFQRFGMIEIDQRGIYLVNWQKHQSIDKLEQLKEQNMQRQAAWRQRKKLPAGDEASNVMSRNSNVTVTLRNALDIDIDKDKERERDLEVSDKDYVLSPEATLSPTSPVDNLQPGSGTESLLSPKSENIVALYHSVAPSLPRVSKLSEKRKKDIRARWRASPDISMFEMLFKKAEASDFLSGRSGRWTGCNFDWLLTEANMLKVLEGTYDNKAAMPSTKSRPGTGEAGEVDEHWGINWDNTTGRYRPNVARALALVKKAQEEQERVRGDP